MTISTIQNTALAETLQDKINHKTKPLGALGSLEQLALQIGLIQETVSPKISQPAIVVFAGDHGVVTEKQLSLYPQEVTKQMVLNFVNGGAAINVFCQQHSINLTIVDTGVNGDFQYSDTLLNYKIANGTNSYYNQQAMTVEQCHQAIKNGKNIVFKLHQNQTNCIGFGEMGIGNTSSASLLMSYFTSLPLTDCVGKGTGLAEKGVSKKTKILSEIFTFHQPNIHHPMDALVAFGGFEIATMVGAFLNAAALRMVILVDGFIATAALLVAQAIEKNVLDYCVFSHTSGEKGHEKMLNFLNAQPLLNLGLRLGEGTGTALAFPLVQSAVNFLNEMATFKNANVTEAE